ncbi:hypothetical protein [Caballeronia sp. dw_19]|uniref:hypothetical protein n=1 Tax=Caballeronia sp. dw_19 TaxID=2719791 RepID=UPI001BCD4A51|nr:hypothetical protein [Caballeronia sp. dw_19]
MNVPTDRIEPFAFFLNQIGLCADAEDLYFMALMGALSVPDICGALESQDGKATGAKYMAWFDIWVAPKYFVGSGVDRVPSLTGRQCYGLRCAALHQGRLENDRPGDVRVIFREPGNGVVMHNNLLNDYLNIDVREFTHDVIGGALDWFQTVRNEEIFQRNFEQSMQRYPNGYGPIQGVPVIA